MKHLFTLLLFLIIISGFSQTEIIEKESLSKRYNQGDFSAETYGQYAKEWKKLVIDIGGYPQLPYDSISGLIKFEIITETGLSKKINFDRLLEWAAISFGSLDYVLHYKNLENGKIILKGSFDVTHKKEYKNFWGNTKQGLATTTCTQTYIFTIKDNFIKTEIIDVKYKFTYLGYTVVNTYVPDRSIEVSIHDIYPITNFESDKWKENLDLLKQSNLKINLLVQNMTDYIKKYKIDYSF